MKSRPTESRPLRTLRRLLGACTLGTLLTFGAPTHAGGVSEVSYLTSRLESGDFRVRVQAALLLGKTHDALAVAALKDSLEDESVAVRAASAAALATLGDPAALPALRRASDEKNAAVKRQILSAIEKLEKRERDSLTERRRARILVKIGSVESTLPGHRAEAIGAAVQASRKAFERMSDVAVLNPTEDATAASKRHKRPAIVIHPSIRELSTVKKGGEYVSLARVEFLVERVPEQALAGKLSGSAEASTTGTSTSDRTEIEQSALGAAVDSALRRSEAALLAAAGS